jgi:SH3-like domain-containing protein
MLLPADTTVEVVDTREGWLQVRQGSTLGWLYADLVTPVSEEIAYLEAELEAARQEVARLRRSPAGRAPEPAGDGALAWVRESVNLRDEPGMDHTVLGVLSEGTRVEVIESGGSWIHVRAGRLAGWVYRDYLDLSADPTATPPAPSPPQTAATRPPVRSDNSPLPPAEPLPESGTPPTDSYAGTGGRPARTLARVFLRAAPGADQESIALISEDTLVHILEERGDWARVVVRGTEGWMYRPLLTPLD